MTMSQPNNIYSGKRHHGFRGRPLLDASTKKPLKIPIIKWHCPPKFLLHNDWSVAAGEESEEAKTQKLREARILGNDHPCDACLSDPLDVPAAHLSDHEVPVVPLIPIEELEEAVAESDLVVPEAVAESDLKDGPSEPPSPNNMLLVDADVVVASAAVMTALLKSKEQGSLIDPNLLVKLLSDPQMLKKLMQEGQEDLASTSTVSASKLIQEALKAEPMGEPKPINVLPRPGTDPRVENSTPKLKVTAGSGATTQLPGSYPVTSLPFVSIPKKSNPVSENFTFGGNGSVSVGKLQKSLASLPSPKSDVLKTGVSQISGPYPVTPPAPLPVPRSNPMVANFTQGHGVHDHPRSGSVSVGNFQAPSPSFSSPKPDLLKMETMKSRYQGAENSYIPLKDRPASSANPNLSAVGLKRFPSPHRNLDKRSPSPHRNLASVGLDRFPSPHRNLEAVGLNRFPSPHRNLAPVGLKRSPSPHRNLAAGLKRSPSPHRNLAAAGLNRFPSPHRNLAPISLKRSPSPHRNLAAVGLNRFPSPHRNVAPVSLKQSPSPYLGDTGFQLEPFSPSYRMPNLISSQNVTGSKAPSGSSFLELPNAVNPGLHAKGLSPNSDQIQSVSPKPAPPGKGENYFKELIRKHGEIQPTVGSNLPKPGNPQVSSLDLQLLSTLQHHNQQAQRMQQRPCRYFNSPMGCRNGPKCHFRHDAPGKLGAPDAKRMRPSG